MLPCLYKEHSKENIFCVFSQYIEVYKKYKFFQIPILSFENFIKKLEFFFFENCKLWVGPVERPFPPNVLIFT